MKIQLFHSNINWIDDNSFKLSLQYVGIITDIKIWIDDNLNGYNCNYKIISPNEIQIFFKKLNKSFNVLNIEVEYTNNYDVIKQFKFIKSIQEIDNKQFKKVLIKTFDGNILTNLSKEREGGVIHILTPPNLKYPISLYLIKN